MEEGIGWIVIVIALLVAIIAGYQFIPGGLYALVTVLGLLLFAALDQLLSAGFFPHAPWVMWCLWGIIMGAAFAFWTIAPVYGLRQQRPLIMATPLTLMVLVALIRLVIA
jgi:hypothetical protein